MDTTGIRSGLYLHLYGDLLAGGPALTPNQAYRIDSKLDDGSPSNGDVRGESPFGLGFGLGPTQCFSAGAAGIYNEVVTGIDCELIIRIQ